MERLCVEGLAVTAVLRGGISTVVQPLSFSLQAGQSLALAGESGSGKTMTANALLGLLPPNCKAQGRLLLAGQSLLELPPAQRSGLLGRQLVLVPQNGSDSLTPTMRVGSQLREVLRRQGVRDKHTLQARSRALLHGVGLVPDEVLQSYPFQLSGGMAQRVVMAMGMAGSPLLVVADEPTRGVDDKTAAQYLHSLLQGFAAAAVIVITHNILVAAQCSKLLVMQRGQVVEQGSSTQLLQHPTHPYTKALLAAQPQYWGVQPHE